MLRILQATGGMGCGGLETLLINLHKHIDRSKIQFDYLIHNEDKPQYYEKDIELLGGRLFRTGVPVRHYFKHKRFLDNFFSQHKEFKIVHCHFFNYEAFIIHEAKKHGLITIAHSHNTNFPPTSLKGRIFRITGYFTRFMADYFFACSKKAGTDRFGTKADVKFFPNGIETDKYTFNPEVRKAVRESRGVTSENTLVLGHVGGLRMQKNHRFLIDVFKIVHDRVNDSKLWLVGEGPLEQELRAQVHALGLDDAVDFTGTTDRVNESLMAMDVFAFPSFFEGLSVALVEAQASGLPCVVSFANQDDSIISDRVQRLEINPPQIQATIWADAILQATKIKADREIYSHLTAEAGFDIQRAANMLQDFYFSLV